MLRSERERNRVEESERVRERESERARRKEGLNWWFLPSHYREPPSASVMHIAQ